MSLVEYPGKFIVEKFEEKFPAAEVRNQMCLYLDYAIKSKITFPLFKIAATGFVLSGISFALIVPSPT